MNRTLKSGHGWEPCKACGLPCIITKSWSDDEMIYHGCAHCLVEDRDRLLEATIEAFEVLDLCMTRRFDAPEDAEVRVVGKRLGYGALMSAASKEWARMFDGTPLEGSQLATGPCESDNDGNAS